MDSHRSDRRRDGEARQQSADGSVHADETAGTPRRSSRRGDLPCQPRLKLRYRISHFGGRRIPGVVNATRDAVGAGMNDTGLRAQLFLRKPLAALLADADSRSLVLKRALGALDLTALGIGAIVGAGIFVLTGVAAAKYAGPAIVLSFIVSGFACAMAALCYAEFAAMIPVAGSAYSYSYATMGELVGWIIGWDLVLEYAVGAAT